MSVGITVDVEGEGDITILRLEGRLDASSSPALESKLNDQIGQNHLKILMDFSRVDYLSSAGMRLLLSTTKKLKAKEGKLVLVSINDEVMEIIKMAGFERILQIFNTEKEAFDSLKQ